MLGIGKSFGGVSVLRDAALNVVVGIVVGVSSAKMIRQ